MAATMRIELGGPPLHHAHQTLTETVLAWLGGGGLTVALFWRFGRGAVEGLAKITGWIKGRHEKAVTDSVGHERNTIEQKRVDIEAKSAEEDRILRLAAQVDRKTMSLIGSLQKQLEDQETRLTHLTTRISQVEESGRLSELKAEAAHIRADESESRYRVAKAELDTLRRDNQDLRAQVEAAAHDRTEKDGVILELREHIQENLERIEVLETELSKHRRASHIAAEITLHDTEAP